MFMGDDGNNNLHMNDVNETAEAVMAAYPDYYVRKVMWDSYTRISSATGNTYPEVSSIIKQQQAQGALIMDYAGHGKEDQISHEAVLKLSDFANFSMLIYLFGLLPVAILCLLMVLFPQSVRQQC